MSTKIFLIGMPGSGKSTLGKEIGVLLNSQFIDLDKEIESLEKRTITQIFSQDGEEYFRKVENDQLLKIIDSNESLIVATGGGTPCFFDAIQTMNENGTVIFIDVPVETLIERLHNSPLKDRPKLKYECLEITINKIYNSRIRIYEKANIKVFGSVIKASQIIDAISN